MFLKHLRDKNLERQPHYGDGVTAPAVGASFRGLELAGEVGEALNIVKKLERTRMGLKGSQGSLNDLAEELADVLICLDLLASEYDIDLEKATIDKFNKTSDKLNIPVRLEAPLLFASRKDPYDKAKEQSWEEFVDKSYLELEKSKLNTKESDFLKKIKDDFGKEIEAIVKNAIKSQVIDNDKK